MLAALPRWSPDDKRLVFVGSDPGGIGKLYVVSSEGGSLQELPTGEHSAGSPNWSDDGSSVMYVDMYIGQADEHVTQVSYVIKSLDLKTGKISSLPGSEKIVFLNIVS
jgi:Tol biopolymer transport system component